MSPRNANNLNRVRRKAANAAAIPADDASSKIMAAISIEDASDLVRENPELRKEVVVDLIREGEILTLIAASKSAKTYLLIALALCKATGRMFLGRFQTALGGKVLIIDCELHRQTLARRIHAVAKALGILQHEYRGKLKVISLRGRLRDLYQLEPVFRGILFGEFSLIIPDPLFRLYPPGTNENDNAHITAIFNKLDHYAEMTGAAFAISHHSSKGNQSGKQAMDVSAGAGSWSRSVDGIIVLRPHEQDDAAIVDVVTRSFPPQPSFVMRWQYPLWMIDTDLNPNQLRQPGQRTTTAAGITPADFAARYLTQEAVSRNSILAKARDAGIPERRASELFSRALDERLIECRVDREDSRRKLYFRKGATK